MKLFVYYAVVFLFTIGKRCWGFNESHVPIMDTVVAINDSTGPFEIAAVNFTESSVPSITNVVTVSLSPANRSDLVGAKVPDSSSDDLESETWSVPGHIDSIGPQTALRWSTVAVYEDTESNVTIQGTGWVKIDSEDQDNPTEAPLEIQTYACNTCLPPLKTGVNLHFGMAQWNSILCGASTCNHSLERIPCLREHCEECHCDQECILYGDCCPDVLQPKDLKTPLAELSCFSQQFIESKILSKGYKFISVCLGGSNKSESEACMNPNLMELEENRPVYSKLTKLHYRNSRCAYCNGVKDVLYWDVKPFCENYVDFSRVRSKQELLQNILGEVSCAVHYVPPVASSPRECRIQGNIVRTCNVTGSWIGGEFQSEIERACSLYSQTIHFNTKNYNNIFCAYCNGKEPRADPYCMSLLVKPVLVPFSMLLDVRSAAEEELLSSDQVTCTGDQVYDPNIDACRPFFCPSGNFPENHQCTSLFNSAKGLGYIVHFILTPQDREFVGTQSGSQLFNDTITLILHGISMLNPHLTNVNINCTYVSHNGTGYADVYSMDVQVAILIGAEIPVREAQWLLDALLARPFWWYASTSSKPLYLDITWLPGISSDRLEGDLVNLNIVDSEPFEVLSWIIYRWLNKDLSRKIPLVFLNNASAYNQISGLMMCKIIKLNSTEFSVNTPRTITVKYSAETLREGHFLWDGDRVKICTNFTGRRSANESSIRRTFDKTEVGLTLVCTSLSLCGLAITLIIYLILPSLRTLPARNNIFLFANLFLAQLSFLTGSAAKVSTPVCRTLAIIIHYFWLSSFCWKVVCAFHMYRLFNSPLRAICYSRSLLKYILFAQLTPCAIIAVVVGVNVAVSGMERFGYAERPNLCFLSGTLDVALGFVTPVCLAVLVNVVFFTRVVYVLRNRAKIQRHTSQSDVKESVLYFKMSLILGFTWVLGFLALIIDDIGLWYVFTVINASIGIFVFIGFGLKNVSLTQMLHGLRLENYPTRDSSKTYETGSTTSK